RRHVVLLGVTGSGKTFTMANVIANIQRPTLVISPNKTLAAQLFGEFKAFFPDNAAEYFVSYYDYYQPEAYIPRSDTYIEKDAMINDEIDRLRHAATQALFTRRDVVIVASVSCIYSLGAPEDYNQTTVRLRKGETHRRDRVLRWLTEIYYERNDQAFGRGKFRVRRDPPDKQRTMFDIEMMQEAGYCSGIENYSMHLSQREPGSTPWTLLDYFPDDFIMFVDESHLAIPQIRGMFHGDRARKEVLVEYGFRLP